MKKNIKLLFFILFSLKALFASSGKISGKITNLKTNTSMIGVNVLVKELGVGTVSDEQGEYIIVNIKPGRYTIEVTYIGFSKVVLKDVVVNQNRTLYQNIQLKEEALEGEEVVVKQLGLWFTKTLLLLKKLLQQRK